MEILLLIKIALLCLSLLGALCKAAKEQSSKQQAPRKPSGKVSHSYRTDPKNRALQANLLIRLNNDVPAAKRLLLQQRQRNPGKSDNWYLEKVIYDLERDRR